MNVDLDSFQRTYIEKVKPMEEVLEQDKSKVYIKIAISVIITTLIEAFLVLTTLGSKEYAILFYPFIILGFYISSVIRKFVIKVKETVFPELFRSIDPNLSYDGKIQFTYQTYRDSNLFSSTNTQFIPSDFLSTKIAGRDVIMSELKVEAGSGKNRKTVFEGVFINVTLDKNIESFIKIISNSTKDFGIIKTLFPNEDKVNLENMEFEEIYDVYCKDQIYARKIITLPFMEKLIYATNKLEREIRVSFRNSSVYIAIEGIEIINDSGLFTKKIDMFNIAKELDSTMEVIKTIEYLNLEDVK